MNPGLLGFKIANDNWIPIMGPLQADGGTSGVSFRNVFSGLYSEYFLFYRDLLIIADNGALTLRMILDGQASGDTASNYYTGPVNVGISAGSPATGFNLSSGGNNASNSYANGYVNFLNPQGLSNVNNRAVLFGSVYSLTGTGNIIPVQGGGTHSGVTRVCSGFTVTYEVSGTLKGGNFELWGLLRQDLKR